MATNRISEVNKGRLIEMYNEERPSLIDLDKWCRQKGKLLGTKRTGQIREFITGHIEEVQIHDYLAEMKRRLGPEGFLEAAMYKGIKSCIDALDATDRIIRMGKTGDGSPAVNEVIPDYKARLMAFEKMIMIVGAKAPQQITVEHDIGEHLAKLSGDELMLRAAKLLKDNDNLKELPAAQIIEAEVVDCTP